MQPQEENPYSFNEGFKINTKSNAITYYNKFWIVDYNETFVQCLLLHWFGVISASTRTEIENVVVSHKDRNLCISFIKRKKHLCHRLKQLITRAVNNFINVNILN